MVIRLLLLFVLIGCVSCSNQSSPVDSEFNQEAGLSHRIDTYISRHAENGTFNGSIIVAVGDSIIHRKNHGYSDRTNKTPISDSTRFLIGSITKPFTAACIVRLVEFGVINFDDPLSDFMPSFPKAEEVTIHQLLTHTSGIRDYHEFSDWKVLSKTDLQPMDVVMRVMKDPYRFDPGTSFSYSNTGYIILGLIIEQVSGMSFDSYLDSALLSPLGLQNSGVISNDSHVPGLALGYETTPRETKAADYINYNQPFSSGNMFSTLDDLWTFTRSLFQLELFDAQMTEQVLTNHQYYGYGWGIRDFEGLKAYGHHGGMNGYFGSITYIPSSETFIGFLTNDFNTPKKTITKDLVNIIKGIEVELPPAYALHQIDQKSIDRHLGQYLIAPGDTLSILQTSDTIFIQETGQLPFELFPIDSNQYLLPLHESTVTVFDDRLEYSGVIQLTAGKVQ